ncbi:MAG TPA: hypothetical protein VN224_08380, partial [Xanthomonadales bacterium]|nr:hypothetical protein [Xanthomonadales bacterium]
VPAVTRWPSVVLPLAVYVAVGFVLPLGVLVWLLAHHQPPYVLDRAMMETPRTALGGNPVAVRPARGVFDIVADGGTTAVYADGSTATIVRTRRPSQVIEKYGSSSDERTSRSFTAGGFTQRDATLADGRVARTFGTDETVFAFVARSPLVLDRLVAQSAVRRNTKSDVGNTVLDGHVAAAVLIGIGWFAAASLLAVLAMLRALTSTDASAPPRVPWYQRPP